MTNTTVNQVSYLRTSREYPEDPKELTVEVNKAYIDTAAAVNIRTIGIFTVKKPTVTGESWYIRNNSKQQSLRQVYPFTTTTAIDHGININNLTDFSRMFGTYTTGTNTYGLIAGSTTAIAGQITFYVTSSQIVFVVGGGAPIPDSGIIILEWISDT